LNCPGSDGGSTISRAIQITAFVLSGADGGVFGLVVVLEENGVRVEESAVAGVEIDRVAPQLGSHHVDLPADHVCGAGMQVGVVAGGVESTLFIPVRYTMPSRSVSTGSCPCSRNAAEHPAPFSHCY
jgi:hypothetical protein